MFNGGLWVVYFISVDINVWWWVYCDGSGVGLVVNFINLKIIVFWYKLVIFGNIVCYFYVEFGWGRELY